MGSPPAQRSCAPAGAGEGPEVQRLLDLARVHLGMDIGWVSHFTEDRQRISALSGDGASMHVGVGDAPPLQESFCVRVLAGNLPPVVPDARRDPRTRDLAVTARLGIGSYVGAPLHDAAGAVMGMLCCLSRGPGPHLGLDAARYLGLVADLVSDHLTSPTALQRRAEAEARREVQRVLDDGDVRILFQPVLRLADRRLVAHEALARFGSPSFPRPDLAFAAATRVGLGVPLELLAARAALEQLHRVPEGTALNVNLSAEALQDPEVQGVLLHHAARATATGRRVVAEITEHTQVTDYPALVAAVARVRAGGVRIAVDDAGAGYASFRHVLQLRPDTIKIDTSLVRGVDVDPVRQALTRSLVRFAADVGAGLVAEGVEHAGESQVLERLGVAMVQGFLYARPGPLPVPGAAGSAVARERTVVLPAPDAVRPPVQHRSPRPR
ncbi:EAL domain-containing protein [Paenibacillus sp. TRM 82003]|uniref:sensor domain-containing phosphodiesterase n=1 Tax=Kineococcus sp. TRM81007 TaxID=2925831 RepID=UPI001F596F4F|nr:EAL domain-containing protein [Kineococcus sp. TRM81007]MCI2237120.1 EAL domain-containing protein [Kineococcus sp. TRM81007]MCI3926409.1 EAL domain-containing protein [Paenibacillus sp. TRM 82003]